MTPIERFFLTVVVPFLFLLIWAGTINRITALEQRTDTKSFACSSGSIVRQDSGFYTMRCNP